MRIEDWEKEELPTAIIGLLSMFLIVITIVIISCKACDENIEDVLQKGVICEKDGHEYLIISYNTSVSLCHYPECNYCEIQNAK